VTKSFSIINQISRRNKVHFAHDAIEKSSRGQTWIGTPWNAWEMKNDGA
jgi:hypothetical protein